MFWESKTGLDCSYRCSCIRQSGGRIPRDSSTRTLCRGGWSSSARRGRHPRIGLKLTISHYICPTLICNHGTRVLPSKRPGPIKKMMLNFHKVWAAHTECSHRAVKRILLLLWWWLFPPLSTLIAYIFIERDEGSVFNLLIVCFQLHLVPCRRSQLYILLKFHAIEFPLWRLQIAILGPDTLASLCHPRSFGSWHQIIHIIIPREKRIGDASSLLILS